MGRGKKGVRFHKKDNIKVEKNDFPKFTEKDMDDEVDIFHKQRDRVPLDINDGEDASDDELEQPVFDLQGVSSEESKEDSESDDDEELTGLAAKIAKQAKILRQKTGGVDDETEAEEEEEEVEEEKKALWGKRKHMYYNADNIDYEIQSSDEEMPAEEEAEVLRLQKKRAASFRPEDFGLGDDDLEDEEESETGSDTHETTFQEALNQQEGSQRKKLKQSKKAVIDKGIDDGKPVTFEEIKKDINALSKEQQMEVVMSDAPELVGLLSEFKDALNNLKLVQSLIHKAKEKTSVSKEAMGYLELKQQLMLCYCQAIVFYLLLKSEGRPVRDHPVIARLVEIRKLLDRIQPLDSKLKTQIDAILEEENDIKNAIQTPAEVSMHKSKSKNGKMELSKSIQDAEDVAKTPSISAEDLEEKPNEHKQIKKPLGKESTEMLKEREKLEAYLNDLKHSLSQAVTAKNKSKKLKPENYGNLESIEDFDDEVDDLGPAGSVPKDHLQFLPQKKKLSQLVAESGRAAKRPKLLSGDDNLPEKEELGDKRRRYETQKINRAVSPGSDVEEKKDNSEDSEDEFYKAAKKKRNATLAAKAEKYSWESRIPQPEAEVEGKRHITYQMEKNKGLTPHRKKQTKNPRKKYKLKHQKAVIARKGQVREVKLPQGPYGGETTGIRTAISRSVRFKH